MSLHPLPESVFVGEVEDTRALRVFQRENVKNIWSEILPLFEQHWAEIAHYKDIPLDPDYDFYLKADELGMLRVFAAREAGVLIGYCVYFIRPNPHYRQHRYGVQDVLFVRKDRRGRFGLKFIDWCDGQLRAEGVSVVTQHVKVARDFGAALRRLGYELVDYVYCRRLNP